MKAKREQEQERNQGQERAEAEQTAGMLQEPERGEGMRSGNAGSDGLRITRNSARQGGMQMAQVG